MTRNQSNEDEPGGHQAIGRQVPFDQLDTTHRPDHAFLLEQVPRYDGPVRGRAGLSAVVVPTWRPQEMGSGLALASRLAAAKGSILLVIRSEAASERPFSPELVPVSSQPTLVLDLTQDVPSLPRWSSDEQIVATLHREGSDLAPKRNVALLIGRMCGWDTMLYLDDDIRATPASDISGSGDRSNSFTQILARLDDLLADFAHRPDLDAAGFFQRDFDDNSVVCHARRLANRPQETFISGGALAVRCGAPLPFFSRCYNEDWIFFLFLILNGVHTWPSSSLKYVGTIHQDAYYPFTVVRALSEELGDLLAEGLFRLLGDHREELLTAACASRYWERAIDQRCRMILDVLRELDQYASGSQPGVVADAIRALRAALAVYAAQPQAADALAAFFAALLVDMRQWRTLLDSVTPQRPGDALSPLEAVDALGLSPFLTVYEGIDYRRVS